MGRLWNSFEEAYARALKQIQTDEKYHIKRQQEVAKSPRFRQAIERGVEINSRRTERAMRDTRKVGRDTKNEVTRDTKTTQPWSILPQIRRDSRVDEVQRGEIPLTATHEQILLAIKDKGLLQKPSPIRGEPSRRDRQRYYEFHEGYGHHTADCFSLRKQIKESMLKEKGEITKGKPYPQNQ